LAVKKIIEAKNLYKRYGATIAVKNVSFSLNKGDFLNLAGENGAGKTTLIKLLGGEVTPSDGEIFYKGSKVKWDSPSQALNNGIGIIHQHPQLIDEFTAAENIFLNKEPRTNKLLDDKKLYEKTEALLEKYPVTDEFDLTKQAKNMTAGERHIVEILKILSYNPDLLVLDEPTASLPKHEVEALLELITHLNEEEQITMVYISHKLDEGLEVANKTLVLRNGKKVDFLSKEEFDKDRVIKAMINEDLSDFYPEKTDSIGKITLELDNINTSKLNNINLKTHRGEIVGLYGLMGAGMEVVLETIFGLKNFKKGVININNEKITNPKVKKMMNHGIYYIPGDRHQLGLFPSFSVRENMTIAHLYEIFSDQWLVDRKKEEEIVKKEAGDLKVKYSGVDQNIKGLSGGNQQKIVVARWLLKDCDLLLLNKPTMGIDVGAKKDIYYILKELAENGTSIMFFSSDINEVIGISNRIYTMRQGEITGELSENEISKEKILDKIL